MINQLSKIIFALLLSTLAAATQDSEHAFFAGKTVRLVVGFGPGGGNTSTCMRLNNDRIWLSARRTVAVDSMRCPRNSRDGQRTQAIGDR